MVGKMDGRIAKKNSRWGKFVSLVVASSSAIVQSAIADDPSISHDADAVASLRLEPDVLPSIGQVDERYQSYNLEMVEVIGGRFWKPYENITADRNPREAGDIEVGRDPDLFEKREPVDLYDRRLRRLAEALGPAYIRISGTWANSIYFQDNDEPQLETAPDGFDGVLTRAQWKGVIDFAEAVDAKIVTSFTISPGVRDEEGVWTPSVAGPLVDYTHALGGRIHAAELFNEPNLPQYGRAPEDYDEKSFVRDIEAFAAFAQEKAPDMSLVGPGHVSGVGDPEEAGIGLSPEALLTTEPRPAFDVFSYHFYGAVSQRCAPPGNPVGTRPEDALTEDWLGKTTRAFDIQKKLRDQYLPDAPMWLTETAGAACGGNPWSADFLDTFRYLDSLGRLARHGLDALFHNTLSASEYGLIDDKTLEPRPNYWGALLWRRLMGTTVLDAGPVRVGVYTYAHCLRGRSGGVSYLVVNASSEAVSIETSGFVEVYRLTSPELQSTNVFLNGQKLVLKDNGKLPKLKPWMNEHASLELPPQSIAFMAFPNADNGSCK